jgi:hypothetical protein
MADEADDLVSILAIFGGTAFSTLSLCCLIVGTRRLSAFEQESARRRPTATGEGNGAAADAALAEASQWQRLCGDWISSQASGVSGFTRTVTAGAVHAFEVRVRLANGRLADPVAAPPFEDAPLGARVCDRMLFGDAGERAGAADEGPPVPAPGERVSLVDAAAPVDTGAVVVQLVPGEESQPPPDNPYGLNITVEGTARRLRPTHRQIAKGRVAVEWTSRRAGTYQLSVRIGRAHVKNSPFEVEVTPSDVSAAHSIVCAGEQRDQVAHSAIAAEAATLIAVQGTVVTMHLLLQDRFGNPVSPHAGGVAAEPDAVSVVLTASSSGAPDHAPAFEYQARAATTAQTVAIQLLLTVYEAGCFTAEVMYRGEAIGSAVLAPGDDAKKPPLSLLVVSPAEAGHVRGLAEQTAGASSSMLSSSFSSLDRVCTFECQVLEGLRTTGGGDESGIADKKLAMLPPTFSEVLASLNPEPEPEPELVPKDEDEDTSSGWRMMKMMVQGMKEMVPSLDTQEASSEWRDVQVLLTPLRIVVREYKMKVIPWRTVASFVSRPSLRVHLDPNDSRRLIIDDGDTAPCVLRFSDSTHDQPSAGGSGSGSAGDTANTMSRNVFFGVYSSFLRDRMDGATGGVATFEDKRARLFAKLRKHIGSAAESRQQLTINRSIFRESALAQLHGWSTRQWYGKSHVAFRGEEGMDCGGLSDEFWDMLGRNLFTPNDLEDGQDGDGGSGETQVTSRLVEVEMPGDNGRPTFVKMRMELDGMGQLQLSMLPATGDGGGGPAARSLAEAVAIERVALERAGNVVAASAGGSGGGGSSGDVVSTADLRSKRMTLRPPKQSRKERPFCIRIDLAEADSCGRRKIIIDPLSNTAQDVWLRALRQWSLGGDINHVDIFRWRGSEDQPLAHPLPLRPRGAAAAGGPYASALLHLCGRYLAKCVCDTACGRPRQAPVQLTGAFFKLLLAESLQIADYEAFDPQGHQSRVSYVLETQGIEDRCETVFPLLPQVSHENNRCLPGQTRDKTARKV